MDGKCSVFGCYEPIKARHLCDTHYAQWGSRRLHPSTAEPNAGRTNNETNEVGVCICEIPKPDDLGECDLCGRLVVTFAHGDANRARYREQYPDQWARARRLRLGPKKPAK